MSSSSAPWTCSVADLVKATGAQVVASLRDSFSGVGTDTRKDLKGQLFIALKGDQFDAHNFVPQAVQAGAAVLLVHEWRDAWQPFTAQATFLKVSDTLLALQAFAQVWRRQHKFKVIAITGSNGKTSTKEFALALFKNKFATHASKGSFNNHWGVPLSILEAGPKQTHLILEMGMNHAGELTRLCKIAEPDIVVCTTVGRAHMGELGSQEKVAQAKEEIYLAAPNAIHVFNLDNEWTMRMQAHSKNKNQVTFSSFIPKADVHLRAQRLGWDGIDVVGHIRGVKGHSWVHVFGRHNVVNLMAASALALAAGFSAEEAWQYLPLLHDTAWGRNQVVPLNNGARVLFDAYNANPDSMTALLKNLYEMDVVGRKFLVVGDMKELGSFAPAAHEELGERAGSVDFEGIWYIGEHAESFAKGLEKVAHPNFFVHSSDVDQAINKQFLNLLREGDLVAVKASRGVALERVVEAWPLQKPLGKKP